MVSTAPLDRPLTVRDFEELPDDGVRYELIWGELYMSAAPGTKHQRMSRRLLGQIDVFLTRTGMGEVFDALYDVQLDEFNIVEPDLVAYRAAGNEIVTNKRMIGAPDLCIGILSPTNRSHDVVKKRVLYASFGIPEYWIVDPEQESITVYLLDGPHYIPQASNDGLARSVVFPGLIVDPKGLSSPPANLTATFEGGQ
jgi:Uma2 family endonuclease